MTAGEGEVNDDAATLEAARRWPELVKLLAAQAEAADRADKPALYLRIAGIYLDRFANMAEAIKAYERVLEYEPANRRAVEALRALFEKRRDWENLLELEKGELDRTPPEKRADKAVEVARLAALRVGKAEVTIYWWQRVLEYEPDHRQALAELVKSFEHAGRVVDLASVLQQQVEIAEGNDDRIAALRRLATLQEEALGDLHAARDTWRRLLETAPHDTEAKRSVERIDVAESARPTTTAKPAIADAPTLAAFSSVAVEERASAAPPTAITTDTAPKPDGPAAEATPSSTVTIVIGIAMLAIIAGVIYFVAR